jgi:hypothetical protein
VYPDPPACDAADEAFFESFVDAPRQTPIAGAAKISGQAGPWTVGLLNAVTTPQDVAFSSPEGIRDRTVTPLANYLVGRARRSWRGGRTVAGGFVSSVLRDLSQEAFLPLLPRTATVAGVDVEAATADRAWTFSAVAAGSAVTGDAAVIGALQRAPQRYYQRPDADYLSVDPGATALGGYRAEASVAKTGGGRHWRGSLTLGATSPGFEANDLGFQERADLLSANWEVRYNAPQPGPSWLNFATAYAFGAQGRNLGGDNVEASYSLGSFLRFSNAWGAQVVGTVRPRYLRDRLTRGGPLAERPADWSASAFLSSNPARRLSFTLSTAARREFAGAGLGVGEEWTTTVRPRVSWRPTDALTLSFEPDWVRAQNTDQYRGRVSTDPGVPGEIDGVRYLFSDVFIEQLDLGVRADLAFSPTLTLQAVLTPQVFNVDFGAFRALAAPRTYDFVDVPELDGSGGFTQLSLRGNAVLRWEWRPGSTVFLVWQQLRDDDVDLRSGSPLASIDDVFGGSLTNVFLLKASYWFGL